MRCAIPQQCSCLKMVLPREQQKPIWQWHFPAMVVLNSQEDFRPEPKHLKKYHGILRYFKIKSTEEDLISTFKKNVVAHLTLVPDEKLRSKPEPILNLICTYPTLNPVASLLYPHSTVSSPHAYSSIAPPQSYHPLSALPVPIYS
jgi:hypothetical protein